MGKLLYSASPIGDGRFDDAERQEHLTNPAGLKVLKDGIHYSGRYKGAIENVVISGTIEA